MLCKGRVRRDYISISYDHWAGKEAELISICALYRVDQKKVSFTRLWHGLKDTFFGTPCISLLTLKKSRCKELFVEDGFNFA